MKATIKLRSLDILNNTNGEQYSSCKKTCTVGTQLMQRWLSFIVVLLLTQQQALAQICNNNIRSTAPDTRYTTNGNEVTDSETGLIWQKCSLGQNMNDCSGMVATYSWQEALLAAETQRQQTGLGWRVPDKNELESLIEDKCAYPSINLTYFPNTPSSAGYWSASPDANTSNFAWYISFGRSYSYGSPKEWTNKVRLVRAGQSSSNVNNLINDVLDTSDLQWVLTGNSAWAPQTTEFLVGDSALQSGAITDSQLSSIETIITGPVTVSFYWKVSSEGGYDYLKFYIDDIEMDSIDGEVDWGQKSFQLDSGNHTLKWIYSKDSSYYGGLDAGWLDGLEFKSNSGSLIPILNYLLN